MASKARVIMAFYGARYVGKWDKNLRFIARGARSKGYKTVSIAQCTQKLLIISQFGSLSAFSLTPNTPLIQLWCARSKLNMDEICSLNIHL